MDASRNLSGKAFQPQMAPLDNTDNDEIDLRALFATLWRGKWLIALLAMAFVLVGGYYAYAVATPLYRATAVVILETNQDQVVDLQSVATGLSGDTSEINSELQVLQARGLMGKVVDRLNLEQDAEFNKKLIPVSGAAQFKATVKGLFGMNSTSDGDALSDAEIQRRTRDSVVTSLLDKVTVSNVRQSLVFRVTAETESPTKSALIADTIVELYILNQIEVKFEATQQATIWLTDRVGELQTSLEVAETEVSEFSAATELVSIEGLQALERQIKELRDRIGAAVQNKTMLEDQIQRAESAETRQEQADIFNDMQLERYLARVDTDKSIATAFDLRLNVVRQRLLLDLNRADQQLTALYSSEKDLNAQVARQGEDLIMLQQLTREAEATRSLYQYFLTRLKETSAQQGIQQADSRVLSDAVLPNGPSEPRKSRILALSGILGVMLGAGLILLREMSNNSFRTARELEAATGYTVLGQIPVIPASTRRKVLEYLSEKPTSAAAEAVRNLRTSLMLSNVDNPPQVILSTSSVPGEGKTTNSLALAQNLLGLGKKVLLIEGDIRRRTLTEYFEDLPQKGIVSVLSGEQTLVQAVHHAKEFGADILCGEKSSTNAADLFASDKFKELMIEARATYDAIIIDTPPVLVVPDARIIAEQADAIIFSVHWDKTSKAQVEESMRLFHNSSQRVSGLVLSQISPKGMKRYGYAGQYGAYSGYGSQYYSS